VEFVAALCLLDVCSRVVPESAEVERQLGLYPWGVQADARAVGSLAGHLSSRYLMGIVEGREYSAGDA